MLDIPEVMLFGRVEEWNRHRILGEKVITDWGQHCDEAVVSICQRENAKPVEHVLPAGNRRKQPVDVVLVDTLREERNDSEKVAGVGTKFLKHQRREGQLDGSCKALVVICLEHICPTLVTLTDQPIRVPLVVMSNYSKQGYR